MKTNLLLTLIAAIGIGCSAQDNTAPGATPSAGGQAAGGQTLFGAQPGLGGQLGSGPAGGGQVGPGGQIGAGGQTAAGGQAAFSGQTASGGARITSGGAAGSSTGGSSQGGATGGGGALASGGFPGASGSNSAGGDPSNDAGSGGNPGSYHPCPTNGDPCKILPLGDSITYGVGDEGNAGYRGPLFADAVGAQQKVTFTGSLSNGPDTVLGQPFRKNNEGHSGWGISTVTQYSGGVAGIATVIPNPALALTSGGLPHVILLHIGTNDATSSTAAQMTDHLAGLIDKIVGAAPDALLVVAMIRPLAWATSVINSYNAAIPGLVQMRAANGKHVMIVDMNTGFTSTMIGSDGIHPNSAGYNFMASRWYSVIGPLLPN